MVVRGRRASLNGSRVRFKDGMGQKEVAGASEPGHGCPVFCIRRLDFPPIGNGGVLGKLKTMQ
jgi:hypothetical protein